MGFTPGPGSLGPTGATGPTSSGGRANPYRHGNFWFWTDDNRREHGPYWTAQEALGGLLRYSETLSDRYQERDLFAGVAAEIDISSWYDPGRTRQGEAKAAP